MLYSLRRSRRRILPFPPSNPPPQRKSLLGWRKAISAQQGARTHARTHASSLAPLHARTRSRDHKMVSLRARTPLRWHVHARAHTNTQTPTHKQAAQEEEKERLQRLGISKVPARSGARRARKHPRRGPMRRGTQKRRRVCACVRVCVRVLGAGDV